MLSGRQGKPADRNVLVVQLQTDIVATRSPHPERVNRLAVTLGSWVLLGACDEEPLLVVLANQCKNFVYSPARLCVVIENRQKLSDAYPWPIKPEFIGTDASANYARERGLKMMSMQPPPHVQHVGLSIRPPTKRTPNSWKQPYHDFG